MPRMRVDDCQPQCIGRVLPGQCRQVQEPHHHLLHLRFARLAITGDGFLHLQGGVLGDGQVGGDQRRDAGAARLAQQQRGLRVHIGKNNFD